MQIENEKPENVLEPFILEFFDTRVQELKDLKSSLEVGLFDDLRRRAHAWKGYSRPFGFMTLESLAIELEKAAEVKDKDLCQNILIRVDQYLVIKKNHLI
jgi:HPt (histidine-containing phosphotransfer) domain-containing protein